MIMPKGLNGYFVNNLPVLHHSIANMILPDFSNMSYIRQVKNRKGLHAIKRFYRCSTAFCVFIDIKYMYIYNKSICVVLRLIVFIYIMEHGWVVIHNLMIIYIM